jgi:hypothetical protein
MAEFTDVQLVAILQKAARRINRRLCLFDTTDEITVDSLGCVTPADGVLEDLVLMQAECLITQRHYVDFLSSSSSAAGVFIKDGEQTADTRSAGIARSSAFDSKISPCAELERQIGIEKMNRGGAGSGSGKLIW